MENHSFILFCVFVITVVASYHVGGRDILFFFSICSHLFPANFFAIL